MKLGILFGLIILCFIFPTVFNAIRSLFRGIFGLIDDIYSLFIPIGKCSCGEKIICISHNSGYGEPDNGYALICQNHLCGKSTHRHCYLSQAKGEWKRIRGTDKKFLDFQAERLREEQQYWEQMEDKKC